MGSLLPWLCWVCITAAAAAAHRPAASAVPGSPTGDSRNSESAHGRVEARLREEERQSERRWSLNKLYKRADHHPYTNLPLQCTDAAKLRFAVTGLHRTRLSVGKSYYFTVSVQDDTNTLVPQCDEATFKARLYGPFVYDVAIENEGNGTYRGRFKVQDPGAYVLQVFALSVEGQTRAPELYVRQPPFLVNVEVHRADLHFSWSRLDRAHWTRPPRRTCSSADDLNSGRWAFVPDNLCTGGHCTGSALTEAHISDVVKLNDRLVWRPFACTVRIYSPSEFRQCCLRCGLTNWFVFGDSVSRELYQNLVMLAAAYSVSDLPKSHGYQEHALHGVRFQFSYSPTGFVNVSADVVVGNFLSVYQVAQNKSMPGILDDNVQRLRLLSDECKRQGIAHCLYYVNPVIQHESAYPTSRLNESDFLYTFASRERMHALNARLRDASRDLGLSVVDGERVTAAQWHGTWDGIHYSQAMNNYHPDGDDAFAWTGGVSMMITQLLVNRLCNSCKSV
jgi:hypothetical protein